MLHSADSGSRIILNLPMVLCVTAGALSQDQTVRLDRHGDALPTGAIQRLGLSRLRHGSNVDAVALSPDGKLVASASIQDRTASLWEVGTGKEIARLGGFTWSIVALEFSPDGRILVGATNDSGLIIWNAADGTKLRHLTQLNPRHTMATFSRNGKRLASPCALGRIQVYDTQSWQIERIVASSSGDPNAVCLSPGGNFLAAGGEDCWLHVWSVDSGEVVLQEKVADNPSGEDGPEEFGITAVRFSPDGHRLALAASGVDLPGVHFWETSSWQKLPEVLDDKATVRGLRYAAGGKILATSSHGIKLWNMESGATIAEIPRSSRGFDVTSDASRIATGGPDFRLHLWDGAGREITPAPAAAEGSVLALAFVPETRHVCVVTRDHTFTFWDIDSGHSVRSFHSDLPGLSVVGFSPDGKTIAAKSYHGELRLLDARTGATRRSIPDAGPTAMPLEYSPDGKLLAWGTGRNTLKVSGASGLDNLRELRIPVRSRFRFAFSSTGELVTAGPGSIVFWDAARGVVLRTIETGDRFVRALALSPDGAVVGTVGVNQRAFALRHAASGEIYRVLPSPPQHPGPLAFSPDGQFLVSAGYLGDAHIWNVENGGLPYRFKAHRGHVRALCFSPDGSLLATGGGSGMVLLWDMACLRKLRAF